MMGISFSKVQKRCNFIFMAKEKKKEQPSTMKNWL